MIEAATTLSVNGVGGVLYLIAAILFLVAAIAAWVREDGNHHLYWPSMVALALCLCALAHLFT